MAEKRYYWLKLKDDFFCDKRIKKLRKIAGGDSYTIIYLKMQLLSIKNGGIIEYEGVEDSFEEELALELDEDVDNVKVTIMFLQSNGMLEQTEKNHYLIPDAANSIGSESESAERVRKFRSKDTKALQCNGDVTECNALVTNCNGDIDIDIDKDINIRGNKKENTKEKEDAEKSALFDQFWREYPKKVSKKTAEKSFMRIKGLSEEFERIMSALRLFKRCPDWTRDNGQFIPHPSTWLNQERWKDETIGGLPNGEDDIATIARSIGTWA